MLNNRQKRKKKCFIVLRTQNKMLFLQSHPCYCCMDRRLLYIEMAFTLRLIWLFQTSHTWILVKQSNGWTPLWIWLTYIQSYSAWVFALLVHTWKVMRRLVRVGQVDVWLPRLFYIYHNYIRNLPLGSRGIKQVTMPLFRITVKSRVNKKSDKSDMATPWTTFCFPKTYK